MDGPAGAYHDLCAHRHKGIVVELMVWQRALSDEELERRFYGAGAEGRALAQAPPRAAVPLDAKQAEADQP